MCFHLWPTKFIQLTFMFMINRIVRLLPTLPVVLMENSVLIVTHQCPPTFLCLLSILLFIRFFDVLLSFGFYTFSFTGFNTSPPVEVLTRSF